MKQVVRQWVLSAWRTLVPKRARNSLRLWLSLEIPDSAPRLIEEFNDGPILVLAPHMDDEIIGPGGAILRHLQANVSVTFVYMTDGMAGEPNAPKTLSDERKAESRRAAEIFGVSDLVFLDGPDGSLDDSPEFIAAVARIISDRKPAIIYAPGLTDHHCDHWATNRILRKTLGRLRPELSRKLIIRGYEVWTPLPANRMAEITSVVQTKRQAIDVFVSQTRRIDYAWTILGLNQYRSMIHLHGRGYAEAFFETTVDEYREFFDQVSLRVPFGIENTPWE
jgi:N-acetylglucosamine malate deacetylase 1